MPLLLVALVVAAWPLMGLAAPVAADDRAAERRVFTYFYYWYGPVDDRLVHGRDRWFRPESDGPRPEREADWLTHHFPPGQPGDWRSVGWFKDQLTDMQTAGIDVALPVYWGDRLYPTTDWSTDGLEVLVQALDELDAAGQPHPKVGLFLDTYILEGAHLDQPANLEWLADQVRAYFRRVPVRHRASQDGRPIIWLYLSNFANSFDQEVFDRLGDALEGPLDGARPFWVAELSWSHATMTDDDGRRSFDPERPLTFDATYRWGAASGGSLFVEAPLPLASVGPGYDDRAIGDRGDERSHRPREEGCFYARNWQQAQALGARWVVVETWNELYEGSGVAETLEWGRYYVYATATYSAAFKRGEPIPVAADCSAEESE